MPATDTLTEPTLFGPDLSLALGLDSPRAGKNHPETSHLAADASAPGLSKLRTAVLRTIAVMKVEPVGSEINARYLELHAADPANFPQAHPDSPRKRAGELAEDGLLDVVGHRVGVFGSQESIYRLSPDAKRILGIPA